MGECHTPSCEASAAFVCGQLQERPESVDDVTDKLTLHRTMDEPIKVVFSADLHERRVEAFDAALAKRVRLCFSGVFAQDEDVFLGHALWVSEI